MYDKLKSIGWTIIGTGIVLAMIMLTIFFIKGGVWLASKVLPWLQVIMWVVFTLDILIILSLGIFKKTKGASGIALFLSSFVYGLTLWLWGLLLTYMIWGIVPVIIGLFIMGVGVVPIALLAVAIEGDWAIFWQLILLLVITVGSRALGYYFTRRADELAYQSRFEEVK